MSLLDLLQYVVCLAVGIVIMAEAENKIRRTDVRWRTLRVLSPLERAAAVLRAMGWGCLFLVGGGVIFAPGLPREWLEFGFILGALASACLIAKARLEEFVHRTPAESDPFQRTQVLRRP
jgi:hypothetical protein